MKKLIRTAFKYKLNVDFQQEQQLAEYCGIQRFVWNKAVAINLDKLKNQLPILWYQEMAFWSVLWKQSDEYNFIANAPSQSIQQTLKHVERAFKDAFDKNQKNKRMPKFKKKCKCTESITFPQGFVVEHNRIKVPKIGWISYKKTRNVIGTPKNITISKKGKYWFASIQTEFEKEIPVHKGTSVGIDVGIVKFATLSNGVVYEPLNSFKRMQSKLAKLQRQLKNKVKFSSNWKKLQEKIRNLHSYIANARKDYLNKISTEICKNHAYIAVEKLIVKNMSKSAKGNREKPGKQVAAKSGLNKSILDQGWATFVGMLEYKSDRLGGFVEKVNPKYTSQSCPCCGFVSKENRKTQSHFECIECGFAENADLVGAINIQTRGSRGIACEVSDAVMSPSARTTRKQLKNGCLTGVTFL